MAGAKLREFLQLAHVYDPKKHMVGAWWMSEKLDGQRAFWDGGVTRGDLAQDVPWANTAKDARYVDGPRVSTGLWSRYGKVISAPDSWLDQMPKRVMCDGELYMGRGRFQELRTVVSTLVPNEGSWGMVSYQCFAYPQIHEVFRDGEIRNVNFKKVINRAACEAFLMGRGLQTSLSNLFESEVFEILHQEILPAKEHLAQARIREKLDEVIGEGGEGLMLRCPGMGWEPRRSDWLLKVKRQADSEAEVIGYTWGRETDKGSRLLGMMGALICSWINPAGRRVEFELSGFTDEQRKLIYPWNAAQESIDRAGLKVQHPEVRSGHFPIGSKVTFIYRELTDDGKPKEARFWRTRAEE